MNINLTTKERLLLEDQKSHEEICIQKYSSYESLASDQELKNIFRSNGQKEKEHLNTINKLLSGQVPSMNNQQQQQQQQMQNQQMKIQNQQQMQNQQMKMQQPQGMQSQMMQSNQQMQQSGSLKSQISSSSFLGSDQDLCTDLLMTEKYVSGAYDTAIFEFKDTQVRDVLNHIQKEEQQHGEAIFKYMENKGMYTLK